MPIRTTSGLTSSTFLMVSSSVADLQLRLCRQPIRAAHRYCLEKHCDHQLSLHGIFALPYSTTCRNDRGFADCLQLPLLFVCSSGPPVSMLSVMTVLTLPTNGLRFLKLVDSNPDADFKIARHRIGMFEGHRQESIKVGAFAHSDRLPFGEVTGGRRNSHSQRVMSFH